MARKKSERPEWFKFWRRNRQQLDIDLLSMESRGKIFTNMMRYFDSGELELVEMTPIETLAFNMVKGNIDESFTEWKEKSEKATDSINARWHKQDYDTTVYDGIPPYTEYTEDRGQKQEDRGQKQEEEYNNSLSCTCTRAREETSEFIPPTVEEVRRFCIDNEIWIDPQRFVDDNNSRNWMKGRTKITDWKSQAKAWASLEATPERQKLKLTGIYDSSLRGY